MCGAHWCPISHIGNVAPLSHLKMLDQRAAGLWSRLADSGLLAGLAASGIGVCTNGPMGSNGLRKLLLLGKYPLVN